MLFTKFTTRIFKIIKFIGRRALFWLTVSVAAGYIMAVTELALTGFLQLLLKFLGITAADVKLFGPLAAWEPTALQLVLLLFLIGIIRGVAQLLISQGAVVAFETINARLKLVSLYEMLQSSSQKFVSAAETNFKIGEIFPNAARFCFHTAVLVPLIIQCITLLAFVFYSAWREASVGLVGVVTLSLLVLKLNQKLHNIAAKTPAEHQALIKGIERVSRNWLLVKVLRTKDREYASLVNNVLNYSNHFIRASFLAQVGSVTPPVLGIFLLGLIIFLNLNVWKTPGPQFIGFLYLFWRFVQTLGSLASNFGSSSSFYPHFRAAVSYFFSFSATEVLEAVAPAYQITVVGKGTKVHTVLSNQTGVGEHTEALHCVPPPKIECSNVSFAYVPNTPLLLHNLSLTIEPGKHFGIVGRSGSGKSTLLALILGVLQPVSGRVIIAGMSPLDFFAQPFSRIGYVGAEPFLIEGSIKDNLDYGSLKPYSTEEYRTALAAASLLDFVDSLPNHLNYWIQENGEGLSAGQKQRLALARALLCKPQILVLDEATANLDDKTEAEIAASICNLKGLCTVIIASHKPGILKFADHIFDFSKLNNFSNNR